MNVLYKGPHDSVEVPMPGGGWKTVLQGGKLNTTNDHANSLLEQPNNWQAEPKKIKEDTE